MRERDTAKRKKFTQSLKWWACSADKTVEDARKLPAIHKNEAAPLTAQLDARMPSAAPFMPWHEDRLRVRLDPLPFPFAILLIVGFALGVEVQFVGTLFLGGVILAVFACLGVLLNLGISSSGPRNFIVSRSR